MLASRSKFLAPRLPIRALQYPSPSVLSVFGVGFVGSSLCVAMGIYREFSLALLLFCYFVYFSNMISIGFVKRKTNLIPVVIAIVFLGFVASDSQTGGGYRVADILNQGESWSDLSLCRDLKNWGCWMALGQR